MLGKKYSEEFKKQVIKEALETGNTSLVGRKHDISPSIVARWVRVGKINPMKIMTNKALQDSTTLAEDPKEIKRLLSKIHS